MTYDVVLLSSAERELGRLPGREIERILKRIESLARDARPRGMQKLRGFQDKFRIRHGDYRILYRIDQRNRKVYVYSVGHRKDVYR